MKTTPHLLGTLEEISWEIRALAVAPDESVLAVSTEDQRVYLWKLPGYQSFSFSDVPAPVISLAFSCDGEFLATSYQGGGIGIWTSDGIRIEDIPSSSEMSIAFIGTSYLLSALSWNGQIQWWDFLPARLLSSYDLEEQRTTSDIYKFVCSSDGTQLVISYRPSRFRLDIRSIEYSQHLPRVIDHQLNMKIDGFPRQLCFIREKHQLFYLIDKTIWCVDINTKTIRAQIRIEGVNPWTFCLSPQQDYLAIADVSGMVTLWSLNRRQVICQFQAHHDIWGPQAPFVAIQEIVWLAQGNTLVTGGIVRGESMSKSVNGPQYWSALRLWRGLPV